MLQSRVLTLRPRRTVWIEVPFSSPRQFSVSQTLGADRPPPATSKPPKSSPDKPRTLKIPPALLKYKSSATDKPRPRRIFDARSLSASRPGGQPGKVLKGPLRLKGQGKPAWGARKPFDKSFKGEGPQRFSEGPEEDSINVDIDEQSLEAELEAVYHELAENDKPVPIRYQPRPPDLQSLRETWPSLPTDATATTAGVVEKFSFLGERYPDGYMPPYQLGKRLFEGKFVRFTSEEEKAEALEEAKKFAQEKADTLSQRKGELVDPRPIDFQGVKSDEHRSLIQSLAQGNYPMVEATGANASPLINGVLRSLKNNETYQAAGKTSQFMAKLELLLNSNRPAKRA
ncbi:hypothetical protein BJX99DRAFT_239490 [Aspergillus californicus]